MKTDPIMKAIKTALEEKKAEDIITIDVRDKTPLMDFHVICTAGNSRKMDAIKEEVEHQIILAGGKLHHIEGKPESGWILVDAFDIIVHIFSPEERDRIKLEDIFKPKRSKTI
jgi:ribosome-associated protein